MDVPDGSMAMPAGCDASEDAPERGHVDRTITAYQAAEELRNARQPFKSGSRQRPPIWSNPADEERRDPPRFVIFGHTHIPEVVPLDPEPWADDQPVYLNTGTWCRAHRFTHGAGAAFHTQTTETMVLIRTAGEQSQEQPAYELRRATLEVS